MDKRLKAKAERRNLIVTAAIECFIENGIHQTGIRDIAAKANVSLGNMYNHFSSKDELITEIAFMDGQILEQFTNAMNTIEDPSILIFTFVDNYLDYVSEVENAYLTIDIIAETLRNPKVAKQFESNKEKLTRSLSATVRRGILEGAKREQLCIDETVKLLLDAIESLGLRYGLTHTKPSVIARKTLQEMVFKMLFLELREPADTRFNTP